MQQRQPKTKQRKRLTGLWIGLGVFALLLLCVLIHYRGVKPLLTIEYGSSVSAADFTARDATIGSSEQRPSLGWHVVKLYLGKFLTPVLLHVRDTVVPTAEPYDREVAVGGSYGPDAFIKHLEDADIVSLTFTEQPDFTFEHEIDTGVRIKDRSQNENVVSVHISVRATHPVLTLEAGSEPPTVEAFLLDGVSGALDSPIEPETMRHVGTTAVRVTTDSGLRSESELCIIDTVAPKASGDMLHLLPNEIAMPQDCITEASDETDLIFAFETEPDYNRRDVQELTVCVTDEGGNVTKVPVSILISGVRPKVVEARTEPLTASDFENEEGDEITVPHFIPNVPGTYPIEIVAHGVKQTLAVTVADTTAPAIAEKALTPEQNFYTKHSYAPEDFFEASDISELTVMFTPEPDWEKAGEQTLTVTAADAYGNRASLSRTVTLLEDNQPPEIYGVINRICYVDEPIAYVKEVFAEDAVDGRVQVSVESDVMSHQTGEYRVVYRAVDQSGNETTRECRFTLIERTVTEEEIETLAASIMQEITTPDMTDAEKLKAIFDYVQQHVKYANGSNHNYTDWRKAAYDGISSGKGDCYNIYSVTRALLDQTDISYLSVERVKASPWRTRHFWVHVNIGTGWYVFDPTWTPKHRFNCFMWTAAQCNRCRNYWKYDESKYPPLATELFDYDAVVAAQKKP